MDEPLRGLLIGLIFAAIVLIVLGIRGCTGATLETDDHRLRSVPDYVGRQRADDVRGGGRISPDTTLGRPVRPMDARAKGWGLNPELLKRLLTGSPKRARGFTTFGRKILLMVDETRGNFGTVCAGE